MILLTFCLKSTGNIPLYDVRNKNDMYQKVRIVFNSEQHMKCNVSYNVNCEDD